MTWRDIGAVVLSVIASVGGIGGIILIIIKFSANIIAERLEKKYTLKLDKDLEKYKSALESKNYISKTKFDTEFEIYRALSKAYFNMVKDITIMIPDGYATYPADKEARREYENRLYTKAKETTVRAQDLLNENAPFITGALFEQYNEILDLCKRQLAVFESRWNVLYMMPQEEKEEFSMEDYKRSRIIREKIDVLNSSVRDYVSKLDVIE